MKDHTWIIMHREISLIQVDTWLKSKDWWEEMLGALPCQAAESKPDLK